MVHFIVQKMYLLGTTKTYDKFKKETLCLPISLKHKILTFFIIGKDRMANTRNSNT